MEASETTEHENESSETKLPKKPRLFSAKEFRNKLKTSDRQEALVEFLKICSGTQGERAIKEYLDKGGSCLELLQLLDIDTQCPHPTVLNIVNYILLQILSNIPSHHSQSLEACRYFINSKAPLINKMLSFASTLHERKTILKLLTTLVTFSNTLGKEILQNVSLNVGNLELLTKQTGEKDSVRSAFIKFVVAFLLEGNFPTISLLFDKKGVTSNLFRGLLYDDADIICIILTALKSHVLENQMVSKTMKMKIFSTPVVKEIVNLYNWKGPENFNSSTKRKKKVEINEYDKSKVSESVHNFLLTLCTSHRYGIIFSDHSVGLSKTSSNNLLFTVLHSLEKPWNHSYASDLILKICKSCPDLVKTVWNKLKDDLEPRESDEWKKAMKFATQLIDELNPECLQYCFSELSFVQRLQVIQMLVAPLAILKIILPENGEFTSANIKYIVLCFISRSLFALSRYIDFSETYFKHDEFFDFKKSLSNYISRNYIPISSLISDLNSEFDFELLKVILEILELFVKICSENLEGFYQQSESTESFSLEDIYTRLEIIKTEKNDDKDMKEMQMKLLKIFLNSNQTIFKTSSKLFDVVFSSVIKFYRDTKDSNAHQILYKIFTLTDIFIGKNYEINIWIESIFYGEEFDDNVAKLLSQSLTETENKLEIYLKDLNTITDQNEDYNIKDFSSVLEALKSGSEVTSVVRLSPKTFSPLILGILNHLLSLNEQYLLNSCKNYLNFALINLLHIQTHPSPLIAVVSDLKFKKVVPKIVLKYFSSITSEKLLQISEKSKGNLTFLQRFWISENLTEYKDVFEIPGLYMFLLNMCVFCIVNFTKHGILSDVYVTRSLEYIKILLENSKQDEFQMILDTIFCHPLLLQYFSPLRTKENYLFKPLTNFIFECVKLFKNTLNTTENLNYFESLIKNYRNKVLSSFQMALEKPKIFETEKHEYILEQLKSFGLSDMDCKSLLTICLKNKEKCFIAEDNQLSLFYMLTVYCLEHYLELCNKKPDLKPLGKEMIEKLSKILSFLNINNNNLQTSELANVLTKYIIKFPHSFEFFNEELFLSIIQKDQHCTENALLASSLLKHKSEFLEVLRNNLSSATAKKALILPLLEAIIKQDDAKEILKIIYDEIEPFILKCLEKPQKASQYIKKYIDSIVTLINNFMQPNVYEKYFDRIIKYNCTEEFHLKLLSVVFSKCLTNDSKNSIKAHNYIITFLHLINSFVRNKELTQETWIELEKMITIFTETLKKLKPYNYDLTNIKETEAFKHYCKFCLKHGISSKSFLIKNLNIFVLLEVFDENNAKNVLEMTTSHSEFLNSLLGDNEEIKVEISFLIYFICEKWPQLIHKNFMPVTLAAYRATRRKSDKIIFGLLQLFEKHFDKSNFHSFKPFLFGSAAASHYSVHQNIQNALWRQPRVGDVLDLIDEKTVMETIELFHLETDVYQKVEYDFPEEQNPNVYDLAFLLPLFSSLLATENVVPTYKFNRNGALSLTILALSSSVKTTRMAACYVLYRYYKHLEAKPEGKDKVLWVQYCEAICRGTAVFENVKLNSFAAIFWAKMALILTMPSHPLYLSLSSYFRSKVTPDLRGIPELYTWLHSSSVNIREHQSFIFKLLQDGMKTEDDFQVALRSMAFKLIMELYNSCVSTRDVKIQVLKIVESACKIDKGAELLVNSYGLLSWLFLITQKLISDDFGILEVIISVLSNTVNSFGDECDMKLNYYTINLILINVIKNNLLSCLSGQSFKHFLNVMYKCAMKDCQISETEMKIVINHVNDEFCNYLLENGKTYVILDDYFSTDEVVFLARKLTIKCMDC